MLKMEREKTRVLCIDHEGGRGGSSKSLYESLNVVDRDRIDVAVWCRQESHLIKAYENLGIGTKIVPDWPRFTPLDRLLPSILALAVSGFRFARFFIKRRGMLSKLKQEFDVIHLNHENLFPLAWLIHRFSGLPISMHIRTIQFDTKLSRWQTNWISQLADFLFFISVNEQRTFHARMGRASAQSVLTNIVNSEPDLSTPLKVPHEDCLLVASIGNFSLENGTDRLIDLSFQLKERGRNDIHFIVAGQMELPPRMRRSLPPEARFARTLPEYANALGLADYFSFVGHVSNTRRILDAAQIGIKLNRLGSNWGRDVLEALGAGVPILAVGKDETFVRPNETGLLFKNYHPEQICDALVNLRDKNSDLEALRQSAVSAAQVIIDPSAHGKLLTDRWEWMHRNRRD
jgi:glycosyltransferase involved in cell wall biosynthesis